jgi:hypothetical protein
LGNLLQTGDTAFLTSQSVAGVLFAYLGSIMKLIISLVAVLAASIVSSGERMDTVLFVVFQYKQLG